MSHKDELLEQAHEAGHHVTTKTTVPELEALLGIEGSSQPPIDLEGGRTDYEFDKPDRGDTEVVVNGRSYGPVACGEHNAVPNDEVVEIEVKTPQVTVEAVEKDGSTKHHPVGDKTRVDVKDAAPAGFQPKCAACQAQLDAVVDSARRNMMV